jgi:hypothetical protein
VTVAIGGLSLDGLGGSATCDKRVLGCSVTQAIRYYLGERDSGRTAWPYPRFRRQEVGTARTATEIEFCIDAAVWTELGAEAARQGIGREELLQHAALFFLADRDAGRVARRVFRSLGRDEETVV